MSSYCAVGKLPSDKSQITFWARAWRRGREFSSGDLGRQKRERERERDKELVNLEPHRVLSNNPSLVANFSTLSERFHSSLEMRDFKELPTRKIPTKSTRKDSEFSLVSLFPWRLFLQSQNASNGRNNFYFPSLLALTLVSSACFRRAKELSLSLSKHTR